MRQVTSPRNSRERYVVHKAYNISCRVVVVVIAFLKYLFCLYLFALGISVCSVGLFWLFCLFVCFVLLTCANNCRGREGWVGMGASVTKGLTKKRTAIGHCTFTRKVAKLGYILNHFIH